MARRQQDLMEIDEIDSLLGDDEDDDDRKPGGAMLAPRAPDDAVTPDLRDPSTFGPMTPIPNVPGPDFSREPSKPPGGFLDVGARDGAHTMNEPTLVEPLTPPTGALAPQPEPPPPPVQAPPPQVTTGGETARPAARSSRPAASDMGGGAGNAQEAYAQFTSMVDPNASQDEMESAIEAAFGHLSGYGGAYKESVMLNGTWYDMVQGYGGPNASFQGLAPKTGGKKKGVGFLGGADELGNLPMIDDESRLDAILASIDAMARGEGGPLVKQSIDELLDGGEGAARSNIAPMTPAPPMAQPRTTPRRRSNPMTTTTSTEALLGGV